MRLHTGGQIIEFAKSMRYGRYNNKISMRLINIDTSMKTEVGKHEVDKSMRSIWAMIYREESARL